jgi:hypothetical protein
MLAVSFHGYAQKNQQMDLKPGNYTITKNDPENVPSFTALLMLFAMNMNLTGGHYSRLRVKTIL